MDPVTLGAITAAGTAGSGLLQGLMQLEAEKRKMKLEKAQFNIQQRDARGNQILQAMSAQASQPIANAGANSGVLSGLISALGGTR